MPGQLAGAVDAKPRARAASTPASDVPRYKPTVDGSRARVSQPRLMSCQCPEGAEHEPGLCKGLEGRLDDLGAHESETPSDPVRRTASARWRSPALAEIVAVIRRRLLGGSEQPLPAQRTTET